MRKSLFVCLLCIRCLPLFGQELLGHVLDGSEKGKALPEVFHDIEKKTAGRFFFLPGWIDLMVVQGDFRGRPLHELLDQLFLGTDLSYVPLYPHVVVIVKDANQAIQRREIIQGAVRQQQKIEQRTFGSAERPKDGPVVLTGKITEAGSGETLPRATIEVSDPRFGTSANDAGIFTLTLPPGVYALSANFVNYETRIIDLAVFADGVLDIALEKGAVLLEEVVIQDQASRELATSRIGQTQISMRELKRTPALLGEVDLIKQIQNLPGVTTVGEAAAGFNVRGGSVDQNLILYDGLPVFSSSHVFGFFSAFNPEAIRDVSFMRGGIPAEYGGRVSSVLDIRSRDGNMDKWNGNAGIGLITNNLAINGPLQKGKTSLAASWRSTYSNWLVQSIRTDYADLRKSSVFFYDGTLKLTHSWSDRVKLSVAAYSSQDAFRLIGDSTYQWDNLQGSVRLDHQLSGKLSAEYIVGTTSYGYRVINDHPLTASELSFRVLSTVTKAGFHYQHGNHRANAGWQLTHYHFNPGKLTPRAGSNARDFALDKQNSIENAFYVGDEWTKDKRLFLEGGVRIPLFISLGAASVHQYETGKPRELTTITDTLNFRRGELIKGYGGVEPRLSVRWATSSTSSLKFGYNRMFQFLHLITNATAVTPVDIWQPSSQYFKPQRADQVSLGYFTDFRKKNFSASLEGFYKAIHNIIDFKDGAELTLNSHLETDLLQGKGISYGIETYAAKNNGRLTGSVNYTYSRSFRQIGGSFSGASINRGQRYPANFDQPHIFNIAWKYNLSRRHFFTGNFTYHTGRPVTIPLSLFAIENTTVAYFSSRNQYRIPDYHRLDLAFVVEGNHKRKKRAEAYWTFSIYNVYSRRNPYTVFFRSSGNGIPKPYQLSIIGTAFPSVSYHVKF